MYLTWFGNWFIGNLDYLCQLIFVDMIPKDFLFDKIGWFWHWLKSTTFLFRVNIYEVIAFCMACLANAVAILKFVNFII